jgi:hypothetical protein
VAANTNNRKKSVGSIMKDGDSWTVFYYVLNYKGIRKRTCKRSILSEKEAKAFLALKGAEYEEQEKAFQSQKYVEDRSLSRVAARKASYGGKAKEIFSIFMAAAKQDHLIMNKSAYRLKVSRYE